MSSSSTTIATLAPGRPQSSSRLTTITNAQMAKAKQSRRGGALSMRTAAPRRHGPPSAPSCSIESQEPPIPINKTFSADALAFLQYFDHEAADPETVEPRAKRRKLDPNALAPIPLYEEDLVITKPFECSVNSRLDIKSSDIHKSIHLHQIGPTTLALCHHQTPASWLSIELPDDIPDTIAAFLAYLQPSSLGRHHASIHPAVNLHVGFQGRKAVIRIKFKLTWDQNTVYNSNSGAKVGKGTAYMYERNKAYTAMLKRLVPSVPVSSHVTGSPQEFYQAAYATKPDFFFMPITGLAATLYPYQRRALLWLLEREGARWQPPAQDGTEGTVTPFQPTWQVPPGFSESRDANGKVFYASELLNIATYDRSALPNRVDSIRGGLLAEEMGLGKTLEVIGLILLHRRPLGSVEETRQLAESKLESSGATLIITPPSLRDQWVSELSRHAPSLRVNVYRGMRNNATKDADSEFALVKELASQDVVIMTYNELRAEIHFAAPAPERSRRHDRKYYRPISPLMQISWWRVCLDEAQEVDNHINSVAVLARMIPRVNAWAVTGTPIKDDIKDLRGILMFLGCEIFTDAKVWERLVCCREDLCSIFNKLSLRHSKHLVKNELKLPAQKRYVINIPFNAVEEQHYQGLFRRLVKTCKLNELGEPTVDNWEPEAFSSVMRNCLDVLRKAALHPNLAAATARQTGPRNALRTVSEVLEFILQETESSLLTNQRALLANKLDRGQLLENSPRVKEALGIWQEVLEITASMVSSTRAELQAIQSDAHGEDQVEDFDDEQDDKGDTSRLGEIQRKLRSTLEIQHKAAFFVANAYYQIKSDEDQTEPDSEEFERLGRLEDEYYALAKKIRREILQEPNRKATRLMEQVTTKAIQQDFAVIPEMKCIIRSGIETSSIVEYAEDLCAKLNEQAALLDEWRQNAITLMCKPLVDEDADVEVTGDEYGDSTKVQEEMMVYIQVLRAALADRHAALSGQTVSKLIADETHTSLSLAARGYGPAPKEMIELFKERERLAPHRDSRSLRALLGDLRAVLTSLKHQTSDRAMLELGIANKLQKVLTAQSNEQTKALAALESEMDRFTAIMNARVDYYRQLQGISDAVAPVAADEEEDGQGDENVEKAVKKVVVKDELAIQLLWDKYIAEEKRLAVELDRVRSERRYLLNLKSAGDKDEVRICPICQMDITNGVITLCGHQFDNGCLIPWLKRAGTCPTCKHVVREAELHPFVLKSQDLKLVTNSQEVEVEEVRNDNHRHSEERPKVGIYSTFNSEKLAEIQAVELSKPSFTTKVDAIVRHILWLRQSDPGAKTILFSQYTDFFKTLSEAFSRYRIGFSSFSDRSGIERFKDDASVECFLLHARAQSSGLNLVNASHVILCEPLLNTTLELQAIARVDRIGQEQDTTVWLYIVDGTVEESIYNLSVQRRMEHMDRNTKGKGGEDEVDAAELESSLEIANSMALQQASLTKLMRRFEGSAAGEEIPVNDLWTCLFGHVGKPGLRGGSSSRASPGLRGDEDNSGDGGISGDEDRLRNDPVVRRRSVGDAAAGRSRAE